MKGLFRSEFAEFGLGSGLKLAPQYSRQIEELSTVYERSTAWRRTSKEFTTALLETKGIKDDSGQLVQTAIQTTIIRSKRVAD